VPAVLCLIGFSQCLPGSAFPRLSCGSAAGRISLLSGRLITKHPHCIRCDVRTPPPRKRARPRKKKIRFFSKPDRRARCHLTKPVVTAVEQQATNEPHCSRGAQPGGIYVYVVQRGPTPGGPGSGLRPGRKRFLCQLPSGSI
jgi:hypothetical protein